MLFDVASISKKETFEAKTTQHMLKFIALEQFLDLFAMLTLL